MGNLTSRNLWLVVPVLALTTSACTAIFGMDEGELGVTDAGSGDSAAGSGGTSGTGGAGGTAGSGGTAAGGTSGGGGAAGSGGIGGQAGSGGAAGSAGAGGCSTDCDDALSCTTDACVQGSCENTVSVGCLIQGACIGEGALNPANACEACDSSANEYQYSVVDDGTDCGSGKVCNGGVCGDCTDGQACTPSTACKVGEIACGSGSPVCEETGNLNNGTPCGTNLVCSNGSCVSCVQGQSCTPTNPCRTGTTNCSTGQATCVETGDQPNGTSCNGTDVCHNGACISGCDTSTHVCVAPPGAGWSDIVTMATFTGAPPPCPGGYPTSQASAHLGLVPGNASCSCTCSNITLTCGKVKFTGYSGANCTNPQGGFDLNINQCIPTNYASSASVGFSITSTSSCASPTVNNNLPTPSWTEDARICGGVVDAAPNACGDTQMCVPLLPGSSAYSGICVYKTGDVTCPAGFDGSRQVVYGQYTDTRACSACACSAQNDTCSASLNRYQNASNNCSSTAYSTTITESNPLCTSQATMSAVAPASVSPNANATCQKTGGVLTGTAAAQDPITICCL